MRIAVPLVLAELVRAPARMLVRVVTLAAAVGLLAAMLLFVGHSLGTMAAGARSQRADRLARPGRKPRRCN